MRRSELCMIPLVLWALLLGMLWMTLGCTPVEPGPEMPTFAADATGAADTAYLEQLGRQNLASTWDALRMAYQLTPGRSTKRTVPEIAEYFKAERGLGRSMDFSEPRPLTVGVASVLVLRAVDAPGGVMYSLMPSSPRYAAREAEYLELSTTSQSARYMTGAELIGMVRLAMDRFPTTPTESSE